LGRRVKKDSEYDQAYQKALYFIDKKDYEEALLYLEIAIKTDILSLKGHVYFQIGWCNGELGNHIKAIEAYKQVIRIDPDHAIAYINLGSAYNGLGLYKDAIEACKQVINIDPNFAVAYFSLGVVYKQLGFDKDAIEAYKQAIRIDLDYVQAHFLLGLTYLIKIEKILTDCGTEYTTWHEEAIPNHESSEDLQQTWDKAHHYQGKASLSPMVT